MKDGGAITVTGSHGALIGSDPAYAVQTDVAAAVFE
jgi:hypothetical protein